MKKHPFFRLIGILPAFLLINHGQAQSSGGNILLNASTLKSFANKLSTGIEFTAAIEMMNSINKKIARDFSRNFSSASDISIFTDASSSTLVSCKVDGVQNRITYDKRGNFVSNLRYYDQEGLPKDVRHQVRRTWYDYAIVYVVEVNYNQKTAFVITLEDRSSWKKIKVVDGEMEVMEEFIKN